jgi:hypothetical protein
MTTGRINQVTIISAVVPMHLEQRNYGYLLLLLERLHFRAKQCFLFKCHRVTMLLLLFAYFIYV